ncbi:MAG TPA: peptidase [Fibrobacteria bacterium]|nr:peptidase [Fibrobacteria bacterium]
MTRSSNQPLLLGESREGRAIHGWLLGDGPLRVSLIAGCHGDEPVSPRFLFELVRHLEADLSDPLLRLATLRIVPDANPDAHAKNEAWWQDGEGVGNLPSYLMHRVRELPGDDLEFGFPGAPEGEPGVRPEAAAVARFLSAQGPLDLHGSLHGLGFGGGPWFLVESSWEDRLAPYRARCLEAVAREGLTVHDVDRRGEKGFRRISEGFCTRPDSLSMRNHFLSQNDPETAALFRPSSMEFARSLGGDPFTFVSEIPLFLTPVPDDPAWKIRLAAWTSHLIRADREGRWKDETELVESEARAWGVLPMPLAVQDRLLDVQVRAAVDLVAKTRGTR